MISKEWQEIERLLAELNLNWDLYKDLAEAQELFMYLAQWLITYKHYSPVSSEEVNETVVRGLKDGLQGYVKLLSWDEPGWKKPTESSTSDPLQAISDLAEKAQQQMQN